MLKKIIVLFFIFLSYTSRALASAWPRNDGEIFGLFEILEESSYAKTLLSDKDLDYYRSISYKLYIEYGLTEKITLGGYLKNYNFYSQIFNNNTKYKEEVNNDYYANIFLIQNLYRKNSNIFSFQYSFYFPIKYENVSKSANTIDTKKALEFTILYGRDGIFDIDKFFDFRFGYFLNTSLGYKYINQLNYDNITFATTFGIRLNDSSSLNFHYQYKWYLENDLIKNKANYSYYAGNNENQIKVSVNYKFLDDLSTELAVYKNYSKSNSSGIIFSFIFSI